MTRNTSEHVTSNYPSTHISNAPRRNVHRISFLPCVSPSLLQKPVEMALSTLMVVTTAASHRMRLVQTRDKLNGRTGLDLGRPSLDCGVAACRRQLEQAVAVPRREGSAGNGLVYLNSRGHRHASLWGVRPRRMAARQARTDMDMTSTTGMSLTWSAHARGYDDETHQYGCASHEKRLSRRIREGWRRMVRGPGRRESSSDESPPTSRALSFDMGVGLLPKRTQRIRSGHREALLVLTTGEMSRRRWW